tara:strand:+ start:242 stop:502 length:261 start_codon:yes stop_codon:yes gene_type:complete
MNILQNKTYECNEITMVFAHFGLIYCVACVVYFVITRCYTTPFMDSLTEYQKKIKKKSANERTRVFLIGIVIGIIMIHVIKPFKSH